MNIIQLTPGAGDMYCGNCLRDNALVAGYRRLGHDAIMVPLYLPLTLDEADLSAGSPIFFGGINVFLDQKASAFRSAPPWLRHWLSSPTLLRWLGRYAGKTRPADVAEMTLSMLRGESGNQARDLDEFMTWLRAQPRPDVLCISNALLLGMTQRLKAEIGAPIVCLLSGEDAFLDAMPDPLRGEIWATLVDRARSVDAFIAPSRYFADRMALRLQVSPDRVRVVPPGLNLAGFPTALRSAAPAPPVLGYFARMNRDKGLDTVVEVFIRLRQAGRIPGLKLKIGGSCGPADQPFVASLRDRLHSVGLLGDVEFHPNLTRPAKIAFLASLSVFCVPALFGEAFGLYLLEAIDRKSVV